MSNHEENDIKQPNIILCEGRDAKNFLTSLLIKLQEHNEIFKKFWVYDFGGNRQLAKFLKTSLFKQI